MKIFDLTQQYGIDFDAFMSFLKRNGLAYTDGPAFECSVQDEYVNSYVNLFFSQAEGSKDTATPEQNQQPAPKPVTAPPQNRQVAPPPYIAPNTNYQNTNTPSQRSNKPIGFVISGVLSIIFGVICLFQNAGSTERFESYGGDAYTGIQQAAAQAANNAYHLAVIAKLGFGFALIIAGIVLITVASYIEKKRQ